MVWHHKCSQLEKFSLVIKTELSSLTPSFGGGGGGERDYSRFQVTEMIKWGQKSKPPKILSWLP